MRGVVPEPLRKQLLPRRSVPGSARPRKAAAVHTWVATTYGKKREAHWERTNAKIFEAGFASPKDTSLIVPRRAAHALLSKFDAEAIATADVETLGVAERIAWHLGNDESLSGAIAAVRGLDVAVQAGARAADLDTDHDGGYPNAVLVVPARRERAWWRGMPAMALRHSVCSATDDAYAEARDHALTLRGTAGLRVRVFLSFAFPDEPWGDEDLREVLDQPPTSGETAFLLGAASHPPSIRRWGEERSAHNVAPYALDLATLMDSKDAIPLFASLIPKLLVRPSYGPVLKTPPRQLAQAIGCYDDAEAAAALAPYAANAILGPQVLAWFRDHPHHGSLLTERATGKNLARAAERVLRAPESNPTQAGEQPRVLLERPWRKKPSRVRMSFEDSPFQGLELERVVLLGTPEQFMLRGAVREMTPEDLARWRANVEGGERAGADFEHSDPYGHYLAVPSVEGLAAWGAGRAHLTLGPVAWVQAHGLQTLDGFTRSPWVDWLSLDGYDSYFDAARSLISPRMAPKIAEVSARRKRYRRAADAWLHEHPQAAAFGLIRGWASTDSDARAHAERALLGLVQRGHRETISSAADRYGDEVGRAVDALLDRDPLALGTSAPKPPAFLSIERLRPVLLKSGGALDEDTRAALVEILQITSLDDPYPGLALVAEACDPESLGTFALELMEQWVIGDAPGRHEWMLFSCVHFASSAGRRRIGELAREWARKSQAKAIRACTALAAEGSDLSLMHLAHIAETTRFAALKESARALLHATARERGLNTDELGDRTVPDLGLGPSGAMSLSYGTRSFEARPDAALRLTVCERTDGGLGPAGTTLPRPSKTDDSVLAASAREAFDQLKKDLASTGVRQQRRLEQALARGRSWDAEMFARILVAQPLLAPMVRGLVWEQIDGASFRVCEDGSYADAHDAALTLPKAALVRLAHPARSDLSVWTSVFSDYELVQPFEQLARAVYRLEDPAALTLARAAAAPVPAKKLIGLMEARGWGRDGRGHITAWRKDVAASDGGTLRAVWPIEPAIDIDDMFAHAPDVAPRAMRVERDDEALPLSTLDPVGASELLRDVEAVRDR